MHYYAARIITNSSQDAPAEAMLKQLKRQIMKSEFEYESKEVQTFEPVI